MLSVTQYDISDISDAESIHQYSSRRYGSVDPAGIRCKLDDITQLGDKNILRRHAQRLRQLGMLLQMTVFPVDRNEKFRFYKSMDEFQLLLAGMT